MGNELEIAKTVAELLEIGARTYAAFKSNPHKTAREIMDEFETDAAELRRIEADARKDYETRE